MYAVNSAVVSVNGVTETEIPQLHNIESQSVTVLTSSASSTELEQTASDSATTTSSSVKSSIAGSITDSEISRDFSSSSITSVQNTIATSILSSIATTSQLTEALAASETSSIQHSIPSAAGNDALHDSTWDKIDAVKNLMNSNSDVKILFDTKFVQSLESQEKIQSYFTNMESRVSSQSADGSSSFFMQGVNQFKTASNCYIVRAKSQASGDVMQVLESALKSLDGDVKQSYKDGIKGYSVCFPSGVLPLNLLKAIPWLTYIERDQIFGIKQIQKNAPWGLARISEPSNLNGNQFAFNLTGEGVTIYTIDSGIWVQHKEFGSRGKLAFSSFGSGVNFDCSGHGTEVASIAAGLTVGVAKKANIHVAQVLDCEGQGQNSDLVAALDWIIRNHNKPAVVNMSVGGPPSKSVDDAVNALISRGVPVVIAAGNSGIDACTQSPSRVDAAIVVGSSNERNERASFSNYGSCLDIFAPGTNIHAASIPKKSAEGYAYVSGTSLSAPFVAGVVALRLGQFPYSTPLEIYTWLMSASKSGVLQQASLVSSPNIILHIPASSTSKDLVDLENSPPPSDTTPLSPSTPFRIPMGVIFVSVGSTIGLLCAVSLAVWAIKKIIRKRRESKESKNDRRETETSNTYSSQPFL